jgi:hypothetical protein
MVTPLSPQSYGKPKLMGPQNRHNGEHPDTMIKDFIALLNNTQDIMHYMAIYSGMRGFIKQKSHNKMYISNEQLDAIELCTQHGINVQVKGLDGECISQMCRYTGSQNWHGGNPPNDWVWVKQRPARCYSALKGRLQWQLH